MTDYGLTTQQIEIIDALSSGATMTAAASQAGIHRNTLANWRRNNLPFQQALAHAQYDRALFFRERCEELADSAAQTIRQILDDPKAAPSVLYLDIKKIVISKEPPQVFPDENLGTDPQPMHNSAQSEPPQTIRRDHPKPRTQRPLPLRQRPKVQTLLPEQPARRAFN